MPLFTVTTDGVVPLMHLSAATGVYEEEIEELYWLNLKELVGLELFGVTRQARLTGGGIVDILALDKQGNVTVIEVKRSIEREQLAQCLEYAGWATLTSLEAVAALYQHGADSFWGAWQEFTGTETPQHLSGNPRLVLVASDFHPRTEAAVALLQRSALSLLVIRTTMYEDAKGNRFIDASTAVQPVSSLGRVAGSSPSSSSSVTLADLLRVGTLVEGDELIWERPVLKQVFRCTLQADGSLRLEDGRVFGTPSGAAVGAGGVNAYDGWTAWRVPSRGNELLAALRSAYLAVQLSEATTAGAD